LAIRPWANGRRVQELEVHATTDLAWRPGSESA
jgi:hypothetical protein